jgi:nitronate monooxygenase
MAPSKLLQWFKWVQSPAIINGPMIGAACPALATEITKAGGIGEFFFFFFPFSQSLKVY